jgi:hypothetical protein
LGAYEGAEMRLMVDGMDEIIDMHCLRVAQHGVWDGFRWVGWASAQGRLLVAGDRVEGIDMRNGRDVFPRVHY